MNFRSLFLSLCAILFLHSMAFSQSRDYLIGALQNQSVSAVITDINAWRIQHKKDLKEKITSLPDTVKQRLIRDADRLLDYTWPVLTATLYLDYKFTGDRMRFQNLQNERRRALNKLAIGMVVSGDKKYLPQIVNGLWTTLEESTWVLPAHIVLQRAGSGLPDPQEEIIDLGDAITAPMVSAIQFMLRDEIETYSPMVNKRIDAELRKRIYIPYLQRNDLWWMGFGGQQVNNWNAWCNTNIAHTALLNMANQDTLSLIILKAMQSADIFINQYPADGGCDEGPSYWGEAGGKLIRILHLLNSVSEGKLNWSDNKLIHSMGTYIYKMQIAGEYFVNFADALPEIAPNPESVYRYGEGFNDETLKQFAAWLFNESNHRLGNNNIADFLETVDIYSDLLSLKANQPLPGFAYLPDLEVVTARTTEGSTKGLFMAVQGSNNGVSHNHNDVGNFIIYVDGNPVIIDAGVGTYTAQTFSNKRYELWNMQSQWHNVPLINGVTQQDGKKFRAEGFSARLQKGVEVSMDIARAYPANAEVKKWQRKFHFNQQKNMISLTDDYELKKWTATSKMNFLTVCEVDTGKKGLLRFLNKNRQPVLSMKYDPSAYELTVEEKPVDDPRMIPYWGNKLYRVSLAIKNQTLKGKNSFDFILPK